jgi:hypothetical protein
MLVASRVAPGKPQILHCLDVPDDVRMREHGRGTHSPIGELTVGQPTTVTFEFAIGEHEVSSGGKLFVVWRWPFDWSDLQTDSPASDGYLRVEFVAVDAGKVARDVVLSARYQWIAGIEPWHHVIEVKVESGTLHRGDVARLVCGDTSGGGRGWCAPTCAVRRAGFMMLIDHQGTGRRIRLVDPPPFRIRPGQAVRLVAISPADAVVGEPIEVIVRAEDCWGNPTRVSSPSSLSVDADDANSADAISIEQLPTADADPPIEKFRVTALAEGRFQFRAMATDERLEAISNAVHVHNQRPRWQLFWGDLHSGQTEIGCGAGSLAEHYAFGRDCAGLQFITHQANDHYVTADEWVETRRTTDEFYEPGRYVPLLGCEWSALTKDGGDRNVFYLRDEPQLFRSDRFFVESQGDPTPDLRTAPELHQAFRDRDVLVNIHVGGRPTNLDWHEPQIERLCEIHSTHGTSQWFVHDALARGYRVGITAGTDGVMGRPGACHPGRRLIRNVRNGLTAVYAESLTRESLWETLLERRCYATTGERIRLWFDVDGAPMGSELTSSQPPNITVRVEGTAAIERIDVLRGTDVIHSWPVAEREPQQNDGAMLLRVLWGGTERKGTARLQRVCWDGSLAVEGGQLELVETINFQSIADTAEAASPHLIRWTSATAGNTAGLLVRVRGDSATNLHFQCGPTTFDLALHQVQTSETTIDAGGINRFVRLGPAPRTDGPQSFEANWTDTHPLPGCVPYWVRVIQVNQAGAWSSPVYVTRSIL